MSSAVDRRPVDRTCAALSGVPRPVLRVPVLAMLLCPASFAATGLAIRMRLLRQRSLSTLQAGVAVLSFSASMTAHVTFPGGGLVVPARTAYDRQLLRDHILNSLRREDQVLISVGAETWAVERPSRDHRPNCESCQRRLNAAALSKVDSDVSYCLACALA